MCDTIVQDGSELIWLIPCAVKVASHIAHAVVRQGTSVVAPPFWMAWAIMTCQQSTGALHELSMHEWGMWN